MACRYVTDCEATDVAHELATSLAPAHQKRPLEMGRLSRSQQCTESSYRCSRRRGLQKWCQWRTSSRTETRSSWRVLLLSAGRVLNRDLQLAGREEAAGEGDPMSFWRCRWQQYLTREDRRHQDAAPGAAGQKFNTRGCLFPKRSNRTCGLTFGHTQRLLPPPPTSTHRYPFSKCAAGPLTLVPWRLAGGDQSRIEMSLVSGNTTCM